MRVSLDKRRRLNLKANKMSVTLNLENIDVSSFKELSSLFLLNSVEAKKEFEELKLLQEDESNAKPIVKKRNNFYDKEIKDYNLELYRYEEESNKIYLPFCSGKGYLDSKNIKINDNLDYDELDFEFKFDLFPRQIEPAQIAYEILQTQNVVLLSCYPGFGKTALSIYLASKLKLSVAVLVHEDGIGKQWVTAFEKYTGVTPYRIPATIPKRKKIEGNEKILISLQTRWNKIPHTSRSKIGTLIVDEAHLFCTPNLIKALLAFEPKYLILCTATPDRNDGMGQALDIFTGPRDKTWIILDKCLPYEVKVLFTKFKPKIVPNVRGETDWSVLESSLHANEDRNDLILEIVKKSMPKKVIILTSQVRHVEILRKLIEKNNISVDTLYGDKSKYNESKILIGTFKKMGAGFDEENFCENFSGERSSILIIASPFKDENAAYQRVGRVLRSLSPLVYDFVDDHRILKNQYKQYRKHFFTRNLENKIHEEKL